MSGLQARVGIVGMLVWTLLFPQQALLASSTLFAGAALAGLLASACVAAWTAIALRRPAVLGDARLTLACGIVSCVAGVALACSPGGAFSQAMFALDVLGASGVLYCWLGVSHAPGESRGEAGRGEGIPARAGANAPALSGAALVAAGAVHSVVRLLAGVLGSPGNVGVFSAVCMFVLAFLPLASAMLFFVARTGDGASFSPPSAEGASKRPAASAPGHAAQLDGTGEPGGAAEPDGAGESAGADGRLADPARAGWAVLGTIAALTGFVVLFFCGFATAPFQVNMLFCLDCVAAGLMAYGAVLCAAAYFARISQAVLLGVGTAVPFVGALASLLVFAFGGDERDPYALSALFWSCSALVSCGCMAACFLVRDGVPRIVACALLVEAAVAMRLFGVAFKQGVGVDAVTMTTTVLVAFAVLVAAFLVAALATAWLAQRAVAKAGEAAAMAEPPEALQAKEAADALRTARLEALQGYGLTSREFEMALRLLEGNTMVAIAETEGVTVNTVRYHARNIYRKTGAQGKQAFLDLINETIS